MGSSSFAITGHAKFLDLKPRMRYSSGDGELHQAPIKSCTSNLNSRGI